MKAITVKIVGKSSLLMHAPRFVNPLDPMTKAHKEITTKKTKTDEDYSAIAKSEFIGGSYWKKGVGFYIPAQNLEACLTKAAKLQKNGVKFQQGVRVLEDDLVMVGYEKKTPEKLFDDPAYVDVRNVVVNGNRVMRCRPIFNQWQINATIAFDEDIINENDVKKAVLDAGNRIGLGDYRPRFGRFNVEFA